ncbi:MAG: type II secretion system F family protein [Xanthomonadaceae bacterium]|nr:type II secretion system F family protein [Xanthomonadaceae bacterium]
MPHFDYEALNADGMVLTGNLVADGERDALRQLERRGLTTLSIKSQAARKTRRAGHLRTLDIVLPLHELATMLNSGVGLAEAVKVQSQSAHHPVVVMAFEHMAGALQRGQPFSDALAASRLPLPGYAHQLVKAGEMTGDLGKSLRGAAEQMEYEERVRAEMRNALIYPVILICAGIAAVLIVFTFVVPKFSMLLKKSAQLPWLAWAVLEGGTWVNANRVWLFPLALLAVVGTVAALRKDSVRDRLYQRISGLPLVGAWLLESEIARWAKMMGTLLGNKVALLDALELSSEGLRLQQRRIRMREVARAVRSGSTLAQSLENHDALTGTGYNLVGVGERTGTLPGMLQSLATLYEEAGRQRMKRLLALIEPLAILVIGAVIGTIILGVVLAITSADTLAT